MLPILNRMLRPFGLQLGPTQDSLKLEGHVYVMVGGVEHYLGQNLLTEKMRLNVAGLLARRAADWGFPVSYDADEGYASSEAVFPIQIAVGTSVTPATVSQRALVSPLTKGGSISYYQLERVLFHRLASSYPSTIPISASFYFRIPAGEVFDAGAVVDFQEWGLYGPGAPSTPSPDIDNNMLARKVARFAYDSSVTDLVVRWEIRA